MRLGPLPDIIALFDFSPWKPSQSFSENSSCKRLTVPGIDVASHLVVGDLNVKLATTPAI